jgi:type VI secretion system protein ImpK
MSNPVSPLATYRGSSSGADQRGWNLALAFQEVLTAVVRVRFGRQAVQNAESFRAHIKESLRTAAQDAMSRGYSQEDVQLALYAVVAFIDESVLNSHQPVFAEWPRLPLQGVLARTDFISAADLLEVFYLCLLLGYKGRYAVASGDLRGIVQAVASKIQRIRGSSGALSPRWALPAEAVQAAQSDPWVKRLGWAAVACLALALLLFLGGKLGLASGAAGLRALALPGRS